MTITVNGNCQTTGLTVKDTANIPPSYNGGFSAFSKFIGDNYVYPAIAKQKRIEGKVTAKFAIEPDGSLDDITILQDPGGGMGEEFVRALKLSPKWRPAIQNGKAVSFYYTMPIVLKLDKPFNYRDTINAAAKWGPIDVGPGFPGGDVALKKFLKDNIRYPREAKEQHITGRIYVEFIVEADGSLTDLKIQKDLGGGLGAEALRVFSKSPKWIPATYQGVPKRIQFVEPVDFVL